MGWEEFVLGLIQDLRWPIFAFIAMMGFRPQLGELVSAIAKHVEYLEKAEVSNGKLATTFNRAGIEAIRANTPEIEGPPKRAELGSAAEEREGDPSPDRVQPFSPAANAEINGYLTVAGINPSAAVMSAFQQVEIALRALGETHIESSLQFKNPLPARRLVRELVRKDILDEGVEEAFNFLANERNKAAHAADFQADLSTTMEYVQTCLGLRDYLVSLP